MRCGGNVVVCLVAGFALATGPGVQAESSGTSSDGPYRAIVDRNVFSLRPMPVASAQPAPSTPPPNVKLVGLMMISGHPQAVISVLDSGPGKQPVSYILSEDQRQASVEVKSINLAGQSARVQIGEDFAELKLETNAVAASAPAPGGQMMPGQRPFFPGARGGRPGLPMPGPGGGFAPPPSAS
jgi:hypothetical protein